MSLFSGIGGIELGLERTGGFRTVAQVEIDPFCRRVLAKHWPEVPRHDDVRTVPGWWTELGRPAPDLVAGGFPCQPFSTAGRRAGIADERWGWPWFWDVVSALRPRYVLVENVAALLRDADAFAWLLGDLVAGGYDADWDCVPAVAVGAPHVRDRTWLVAHARPQTGRRQSPGWWIEQPQGGEATRDVADTGGVRRGQGPRQLSRLGSAERRPAMAHANGLRRHGRTWAGSDPIR
jgi:DNA (cytosine-5)-methyltransferase 1